MFRATHWGNDIAPEIVYDVIQTPYVGKSDVDLSGVDNLLGNDLHRENKQKREGRGGREWRDKTRVKMSGRSWFVDVWKDWC